MTITADMGGEEQYGRKEVIAVHGRCGKCLYADLEHMGTVECRRGREAPYFEPTGKVSNIRPRVGAYYWCGEFRAASPTPNADEGERK